MKNKFFHIGTAYFVLALLTACTRSLTPAEIEYDHSLSPYHTVKRGDSISSVARRYHMDKMELIRLNGLKAPYYVVIGQRLLIRPLAATAKIKQSMPDSADMPAMEPVDQGGVQVNSLTPLPGTDEVARDPSASYSQAPEVSEDEAQQPTLSGENETTEAEETLPSPEAKKTVDISAVPSSERSYRLPVQGRVVRGFKPGKNGNDGINISAPKGTPVMASNNGVVAHAGNQLRGFGNVILIKHDNEIMSVYAHLNEVTVKRGDSIKSGQKIGTVGKTGTVKEPQLHFEIRKGATPVDPYKYLG